MGILNDWVVETVATLCRAGETALTVEALLKHALQPDQRLRLEMEARTGEFKIERAKAQSAQELQQLLGNTSPVPNSQPRRTTISDGATTIPLPPKPRSSSRIERAAHRDPVGEQVLTGNVVKCTFPGNIEVTRRQFQESGVTCIECPICGARRSLKSPKDQPHFPSHPLRKSSPPRGEQRWAFTENTWVLLES